MVEPLTVVEGVGGGVAVPVPVAVIVGVAVPELEGVPVPLIEIEPVLDAETPAVSEDVGDVLTVLLALRVDEGVMGDVPVPELVGVLVELPVGVCVGVIVLLREVDPVLLAEAPEVIEAVGDMETVELPLTVVDAVFDAVPVPELVGVPVILLVGVCDGVGEELSDVDPVLLADAPAVIEAVGDTVTVELPLNVVVGVTDPVPVPVCVGLEDGVGDCEVEGVMDVLAPRVIEGVGVGVTAATEAAPEPMAVREAAPVVAAEAVAVGGALELPVALAVGAVDAPDTGLVELLLLAVALAVAAADAEPVSKPEPVAVALPVLAPDAPGTKLRVAGAAPAALSNAVCVDVVVAVDVALVEAAPGADCEPDPVAVPLSVLAPDAPGTKLRVAGAVPAALRVAVCVSAAVGGAVTLPVPLSVGAADAPGTRLAELLHVPVALAVAAPDVVLAPVTELLSVGAADSPGMKLAELLLVAAALAVAAPDEALDPVAVELSVLAPEAPGTKLRVAVAVLAVVCDAVCVAVAVSAAEAVDDALPVAVALVVPAPDAVLERATVEEPVRDPIGVSEGVPVPDKVLEGVNDAV